MVYPSFRGAAFPLFALGWLPASVEFPPRRSCYAPNPCRPHNVMNKASAWTKPVIQIAAAGLGAAVAGPLGGAIGGWLGDALGHSATELVRKAGEKFGEKAGEKLLDTGADALLDQLADSPANLESLYRDSLRLSLDNIRAHLDPGSSEAADWFVHWNTCLTADVPLDLPALRPGELVTTNLDHLFRLTLQRLDAQGNAISLGSVSLNLVTRTLPPSLVAVLNLQLPALLNETFAALIVTPAYDQAWKQTSLKFENVTVAMLKGLKEDNQQLLTGLAAANAKLDALGTSNIVGFSSEQIAPLLQAAGSAQQARIDELAARLNTSREAVLGFFKILQEEDVPVEQLQTKLTLIAQRYVGMLERLATLDPEDAEPLGYIQQARDILGQAASAADYNRVDELLSKAEAAQERGLQGAEDLEREAHEAASRIRRGTAATRAERGELGLTRLDYLQAAQHFKSAASLVAGADLNLKLVYLTRSAHALRSYGDEKGDNAILTQAIGVYRGVLREITRDRMPLDWAAAQTNLGLALWTLGERESGTGLLEEAVSAFREALKEYTQERVPLQWATALSNLGNAFWRLGERESGTARLEEAVFAYREALKEYTQERVPLDWARMQSNLGNALRSLGERESGTGRLREAVNACHEALKEYTQERVPLDWAMSQSNLGNALVRLGERESGTGRMEEAAFAYREALKEYTQERVPLQWAMTQNNLGIAFGMWGEREHGTERLEEAVVSFREALKERTRDRVPLDWAMSQNNLAVSLQMLGARERGTGRLQEARAAIGLAWDVYREAGMYQHDPSFEARLRSIDDLIASRSSGS
jgi:tetratricopeptide (TPR) repeat protein